MQVDSFDGVVFDSPIAGYLAGNYSEEPALRRIGAVNRNTINLRIPIIATSGLKVCRFRLRRRLGLMFRELQGQAARTSCLIERSSATNSEGGRCNVPRVHWIGRA